MAWTPGRTYRPSSVLSVLGATATGVFLLSLPVYPPAWIFVVSFLGLLAWVIDSVVRESIDWIRIVTVTVMALTGVIAAPATSGMLIVVLAAAVIRTVANIGWRQRVGVSTAILAAVALPGGFALAGAIANGRPSFNGLAWMEVALVVAALAGFSRRQFVLRERASQELLLQRIEIEKEMSVQATGRQREALSRDIHDVLAHSLGALVIQLDATEALVQAGDTTHLILRLGEARDLAVAGFSEARRAVEALGENADSTVLEMSRLQQGLKALIDVHRVLGGHAEWIASDLPATVSAQTAVMFRRVLQEAMTNVRKHAPGMPVTVIFEGDDDTILLRVANPVTAHPSSALSSSGTGRGIAGMRARLESIPSGNFHAVDLGDQFVVEARVTLPRLTPA